MTDTYDHIIVESFIPNSTSGHHGEVHIRPAARQIYPQNLFVKHNKAMVDTSRYPVGTKFRWKVKLVNQPSGNQYLGSYHGWSFEVVSNEEFERLYPVATPDPKKSNPRKIATKTTKWTTAELKAAVVSYLEMFAKKKSGQELSKAAYYKALSDQFGRTASAFEWRMQNISYVLSLLGRSWLAGLPPAKNVGSSTAKEIEALLTEIENRPRPPVAEFEAEVKALLSRGNVPKPTGNHMPSTSTTIATQFARDSRVKAWVLQEAKGVCDLCDSQSPFNGSDSLPYLEVHHVRQLADGGSDSVENAVALCPNCHRELHYGEHASDKLATIYQKIRRLTKE